MVETRHSLLQRVKSELKFLESGGYRRSSLSQWRAPYIFEDSPSCLNFSDPSRPHLCQDCWLMQFVPSDLRDEQVPCRFIPLTSTGLTVDSLYRTGTPEETEEALGNWLRERIHEIEVEEREMKLALRTGTRG